MFGIIYALTSITGATISGIKGMLQNQENYRRAEQRDSGETVKRNTYYDRRGIERSRYSDEIITTKRDYNSGDTIQTDQFGNVIRNLSEEQRKHDYENAKASLEKGHKNTTILYDIIGLPYKTLLDKTYHGPMVRGAVYKDVYTDENLYCRSMVIGYRDPKTNTFTTFKNGNERIVPKGCFSENVVFYINQWGSFVRLADSQFAERKMYIDAGLYDALMPMVQIDEFFKRFNEAQRKDGWYGVQAPDRHETNIYKKSSDADRYFLNDKCSLDKLCERYINLAIESEKKRRGLK